MKNNKIFKAKFNIEVFTPAKIIEDVSGWEVKDGIYISVELKHSNFRHFFYGKKQIMFYSAYEIDNRMDYLIINTKIDLNNYTVFEQLDNKNIYFYYFPKNIIFGERELAKIINR